MAEGSLITDEMRKLIGAPGEQVIFKVEEGAIQRYAQAIGNPDPLFNDIEHARNSKYGRLICPPGFTGWPIKGSRPAFKVLESLTKAGAPPRLLDGGIEHEFFMPIGAGDTLTATTKIADISEKKKMMFTTVETEFLNESGEVALRSRATFINL